jgi:cytochrome c biogenesis protein CcmG/thiol:disulfide interchange protein DsbE
MNKIPLVAFFVLAALFGAVLLKGINPAEVPSVMVGKPVPSFIFLGGEGFSGKDLRGNLSIVNIFASWCLACQLEQGILEEMSRAEKISVYGINYKDTPERREAWLKKYGDPYDFIGDDRDGRVAIDFGVTGVPETFIVDARGIIRYRHAGPVTDDIYHDVFRPLLAELRK